VIGDEGQPDVEIVTLPNYATTGTDLDLTDLTFVQKLVTEEETLRLVRHSGIEIGRHVALTALHQIMLQTDLSQTGYGRPDVTSVVKVEDPFRIVVCLNDLVGCYDSLLNKMGVVSKFPEQIIHGYRFEKKALGAEEGRHRGVDIEEGDSCSQDFDENREPATL
jgi:hypothetical protein